MDVTREQAWELLQKHVTAPNLQKHCLAVEAAMVGYAEKFGEDSHRWSLVGLLHDLDYEAHPDEHPLVGVKWLEDMGFDAEFTTAVAGHADRTGVPRTSRLAKTLYAVDEMAGFVVACVLVRPDRSFEGLKPKSVKKKLKDKAFAKAVDREQLQQAAEDLEVTMDDHIQTVIEGLREGEKRLQEDGLSLISA